MKQTVLMIVSAVVIVTISYIAGCKAVAVNVTKSASSLDNAIAFSMEYLANSTLDSGRFVYNASVDFDIKYSQKTYNALRHAGTLYSMYLCERILKDNSLKEKRYLASEYFVKNYIKEVLPEKYAVVSKPDEENLEAEQAKLGGSGLALLGLSSLYPEGKIDLKILRGLGDFIIYMQNPDGSFVSKYDTKTAKKDEKFTSLYYPGEAAYGLLFLNEVDSQKKWVEASKKALLYLANSRKNKKLDVPFDHWALLATRKLLETPDNTLTPEEKVLLQMHAQQIVLSRLNEQIKEQGNTYQGAFIDNFKLCSLGTMMEGFVAAYYITDDETLKKELLSTLELGTEFLNRYQVKTGKMRGGIPTTAYWTLANAPESAKVIRIDNVQHVLSAWITFKEIADNKK